MQISRLDRKGLCGTHLRSAQPNINETFKEMYRNESKSYRKKKFNLRLFVTLPKYKASANHTLAKYCQLKLVKAIFRQDRKQLPKSRIILTNKHLTATLTKEF